MTLEYLSNHLCKIGATRCTVSLGEAGWIATLTRRDGTIVTNYHTTLSRAVYDLVNRTGEDEGSCDDCHRPRPLAEVWDTGLCDACRGEIAGTP